LKEAKYVYHQAPYSLHDMNVVEFEPTGDDLIMRTQSGMIQTTPPYHQSDGHVVFHKIGWDFSYAYLLHYSGNVGALTGEKMFLRNFIARYFTFGFTIMDETYGYNCAKYSGYLTMQGGFWECIMEIYYEGDLLFVTEA